MNQHQTPEPQGHWPVVYFAVGEAMMGDPQFSSIHDGKRHLFLKNDDTDALALWNNDEAKCIANAQNHWASKTTV